MNHIELIIEVGRTKGIDIAYKFTGKEENNQLKQIQLICC